MPVRAIERDTPTKSRHDSHPGARTVWARTPRTGVGDVRKWPGPEGPVAQPPSPPPWAAYRRDVHVSHMYCHVLLAVRCAAGGKIALTAARCAAGGKVRRWRQGGLMAATCAAGGKVVLTVARCGNGGKVG